MKIIYPLFVTSMLVLVSACHHEKPTVESTDGAATQPAQRPVSTRY